jgi:hypothetical protein
MNGGGVSIQATICKLGNLLVPAGRHQTGTTRLCGATLNDHAFPAIYEAALSVQSQPSSFSAVPECQIFVMC